MGSGTCWRSRTRRESRTICAAAVCVGLLAMLSVALPASGAPPTIGSTQRQADAIVGEINSLDSDLNRAVEAYDGARVHLAQTERAIKVNTLALRVAKHNYKRAQKNIAERLRALYMSGGEQSALEIILGARSLDDVISNLDTAEQVTAQDEEIARSAKLSRAEVTAREKSLVADRTRASQLLAEAGSRRATIELSIVRRERLLSSVKEEIVRMQTAERKRQLLIAAQVRTRLAEQAKTASAQSTPTTPPTDPTSQPSEPTTTSNQTGSSGTTVTPPAPLTPPSRYGGVVAIATRYLGVPYQWGGASPATGFDCSGFTMYVYAQIGVSLPHYTGDQWQMGIAVSRDELQPGDLVFFDGLGHEGIYIGANQFIHAPHTGDVVKISSITGWYANTYVGARRL